MPQIQVLEREDPTRNPYNTFMEQLRQQQETIANVQYKQAQIAYNKELSKIEAKKAQNEGDKFKADLEVQEWGVAEAILKQAQKAATKKDGSIDPEVWGKFASEAVLNTEPGVGKKLAMLAKQAPTYGDTQSAVQAAGAQADIAFANKLSPPQQGIEPNRVGMVAEQPISQPTEDGYELGPEITRNGMTLINPAAKSKQIYNEVMTRKSAEREADLVPLKAAYVGLQEGLMGAAREMGGFGESGAEAMTKGTASQIAAQLGQMPETQAYYKTLQSFALSLASYLNRGRPSDRDMDAALATVMSPKYPRETNIVLMRYIETLIGLRDPVQMEVSKNRLYDALVDLNKPSSRDESAIRDTMSRFNISKEEAKSLLLETKLESGGM